MKRYGEYEGVDSTAFLVFLAQRTASGRKNGFVSMFVYDRSESDQGRELIY